MQNYKITVSYDGTRYSGWESHSSNDMTIQGRIENVLTRLAESPVKLIGAGRTDAGVHALGMIANFTINTTLSTHELRNYLNRYLPEDICIKEVTKAAERFHSRYNAIGKTYRYTCYNGSLKPVFDRKYVYILENTPDIDKMRMAAGLLIGTHDFASFCGNARIKKSTIRTINSIEILKNGDYITFTYHGNGFLQYMVRIITGTLLEVGYGMRTPESMTELIESRHRALAGITVPACGLCLVKVDYN